MEHSLNVEYNHKWVRAEKFKFELRCEFPSRYFNVILCARKQFEMSNSHTFCWVMFSLLGRQTCREFSDERRERARERVHSCGFDVAKVDGRKIYINLGRVNGMCKLLQRIFVLIMSAAICFLSREESRNTREREEMGRGYNKIFKFMKFHVICVCSNNNIVALCCVHHHDDMDICCNERKCT